MDELLKEAETWTITNKDLVIMELGEMLARFKSGESLPDIVFNTADKIDKLYNKKKK